MTLHGTDVRLELAQRKSVVFVCEEGYGWCSVNALLGARKELLKSKKSLIILKMKKHKEESIGPNQYIHFLLVMESVCNSSLNIIDLQSSCFFSFLFLLPSLFLPLLLPMLLHPKGQRVCADSDLGDLCILHDKTKQKF